MGTDMLSPQTDMLFLQAAAFGVSLTAHPRALLVPF